MTVSVVCTQTGTFGYKGRVYPYIDDAYNGTRANERAVEVPIALSYRNQAQRVLEIGAVLPHYIPGWPAGRHDCIDLHEEYPGVVNADVLTYKPKGHYDLIICISTLDHLLNSHDVKTAVSRLLSWLRRGGLLFATVPANQPPEVGGGAWLDALVLSGDLGADITRMDKMSPFQNGWQERPLHGSPSLAYNRPTPQANTLYLMEWRR